MKIKLSISIACFNNAAITSECLRHLKDNTEDPESIEVILTDNGSSDNTADLLTRFNISNKKIIKNKINRGFGVAHNNALELATGKYFLVLNNDLFLSERGWNKYLYEKLEKNENLIVGLQGTNCTFRPDGTGYAGNRLDYIEGSFLTIKTELAKKYGLFSPEYKMFVCEDSDLSLRYRQMGFSLNLISLKYYHKEHSTLDIVNSDYRHKIYTENVTILRNRWSKCFGNYKFKNMILIRLSSLGIGDVLCATPVINALRKDHPTAQIDVESRFADVFKNHPNVNQTIEYGTSNQELYDRVINLEPDYSLETPLYVEFSKLASVTLENKLPEIYLSEEEINIGKRLLTAHKQYKKFIVCSLLMKRVEWQGRNWTLEKAREFVRHLSKVLPEDYGIIEVGNGIPSTGLADIDLINKTSLRDLFTVISLCDSFVGIDSLPFHVAQAFSKPSVILFGATKPSSRIVDMKTTNYIINNNISCVGCYHVKKQSVFNHCDRGDEMCMKGINTGSVVRKLMEIIL